MKQMSYSRRLVLALGLGGVLAAAGCGSKWMTDYTPVGAQAANWRLSAVNVTVPRDLTVSESNSTYLPKADIVWQEEPAGDRYAQVGAIVREGVSAGARGLSGRTPVRLDVVVRKFHALNLLSISGAPTGTGVENVYYDVTVVDARTGRVLLPSQRIMAELPGLTGSDYTKAAERGESQRMRIVAHIQRTTAGWLGVGPDNRESFTRIGG